DNQDYIAAKPPEDSPFYAGWDAGGMWLEERYKQASLARRKLDQAQKERQELFELETDYNNKRIARLEAKKAAATVNADMDGVVVALQYAYAGDRVAEGSAMMAVGDPDQLVIRSEYISKSTVNKAVELYAIINGSRFEVQYENMEPEEYRRLKKLNDEVYSTFYVSDPEHRVQPGQSALLVAVESCRENALCIPKEAIHRDDSGNYVYLYENGESVYHQVQTGVSDGGFTEITGGLKEGDPVVYDASYHIGEKRVEAERGEVSVHFSTEGYLFYPTAEWLTNPAKNGTSYLKERCVERFEQISQGQVLARVEVIADRIGIERLQRKLDRQRDRLADLQEKRSKTYAEEDQEIVDRAIRDRNRSIEELNHQMEKLARYSGVLEITSPCDGLVIDVNGLEEGSLISYQERLVQIADDRSCFIIVEDKNGQLSYGDTAQVSFKTNNGAALESQGQVVTMNRRGLSKEMITDYAMVRVPQEDFAAITGAGSESANGYWSRSRFSITADVRQMHDVVMVPKNATITIGGDTYAAVKTEDNSNYRLVRFVAGGSDNANYWVAYGDITEGMTLCY
ncbi:MAG: hypothetical protein IJT34_07060, partial [Butyrivibrio sp.]|nr:hypothetical protein [Butyrivibrio sp.]